MTTPGTFNFVSVESDSWRTTRPSFSPASVVWSGPVSACWFSASEKTLSRSPTVTVVSLTEVGELELCEPGVKPAEENP